MFQHSLPVNLVSYKAKQSKIWVLRILQKKKKQFENTLDYENELSNTKLETLFLEMKC